MTLLERRGAGFKRFLDRIVHLALRVRYARHVDLPQTYREALRRRVGIMLVDLMRDPTEFTLVERERLDPDDPEHATWRIALEARGTVRALPGDLAYLLWHNDRAAVDELLQRSGANGDEPVRILSAGSGYFPARTIETTLRDALARHVEIEEASQRTLRRAGLTAIADHNAREEARHRAYHRQAARRRSGYSAHPDLAPFHVGLSTALDASATGRPGIEEIVARQERTNGRQYSMSDCRAIGPDAYRIEITVSQVEREVHDVVGATSAAPGRSTSFFARAPIETRVMGWILPEVHYFPSVLGRDVPTIVVVTGSGISGLISLLRSGRPTGRMWVVYGVRSWRTKHLYGPELERAVRDGRIERLDVATSRPRGDEGPARRVQGLLWDERTEVVRWLADGAHLYLSGRLSMGIDVRETLVKILVDAGVDQDHDSAQRRVADWTSSLRFQASVSGV